MHEPTTQAINQSRDGEGMDLEMDVIVQSQAGEGTDLEMNMSPLVDHIATSTIGTSSNER